MPEEKQDIFVEVQIRAIKNGTIHTHTVNYSPRQSKSSLTKMEADLADLLKSWGDLSLVADPGKK